MTMTIVMYILMHPFHWNKHKTNPNDTKTDIDSWFPSIMEFAKTASCSWCPLEECAYHNTETQSK